MAGDPTYRAEIREIVRPGKGRRSRGRLRVDMLMSSIGPVFNLSAGGMRTIVSRVKKGGLQIDIHTEGGILRVTGHVVWSQRLGFFRHEVGIQFEDVDDETAKRLGTIAMQNRNQRMAG